MPRYFMRLIDGEDVVRDGESIDMLPDAIPGEALCVARDYMVHDVKAGTLNLAYCIEVHDETGERVHALAFSDAIEVSGPQGSAVSDAFKGLAMIAAGCDRPATLARRIIGNHPQILHAARAAKRASVR